MPAETPASHSHAQLKEAFERQTLFADKTWRLSPEPWPLTRKQLQELERIGEACVEFFRALELLYTRSWQGKNLLRNRELTAPWVASYLDRGKPPELIAHARHSRLKNAAPVVLRPDLLATEDGFALTEMDAVPGGTGLTAYLNQLYGASHAGIVGGTEMVDAFHAALAELAPGSDNPFIAIVVSDEAAVYRPEFEWLASRLHARGRRVQVMHPSEIMPLGTTLCAPVEGNPERIDIIYRFFELFDLENVSTARDIMAAAAAGEIVVTPPMRHFQEEKLNLALLHHPVLEDFWRENLPRKAYKLLMTIVPHSWVMDPVELPPNAVLDAPWVGGKPIRTWGQLGEASQKERNLIIKASGFHETAWGARSVTLGSDSSRGDWSAAIARATSMADEVLHVLQDYRKPIRQKHAVYQDSDTIEEAEGRLRLTPFYFVRGGGSTLAGALATFCPADKKIIHGMRDAAMLVPGGGVGRGRGGLRPARIDRPGAAVRPGSPRQARPRLPPLLEGPGGDNLELPVMHPDRINDPRVRVGGVLLDKGEVHLRVRLQVHHVARPVHLEARDHVLRRRQELHLLDRETEIALEILDVHPLEKIRRALQVHQPEGGQDVAAVVCLQVAVDEVLRLLLRHRPRIPLRSRRGPGWRGGRGVEPQAQRGQHQQCGEQWRQSWYGHSRNTEHSSPAVSTLFRAASRRPPIPLPLRPGCNSLKPLTAPASRRGAWAWRRCAQIAAPVPARACPASRRHPCQ